MAAEEGISAGISSGASLAVAMQVAERAPQGSAIRCMLPDIGERYLSTPPFDGVATDMTPEEEALSRSTPGFVMPGRGARSRHAPKGEDVHRRRTPSCLHCLGNASRKARFGVENWKLL